MGPDQEDQIVNAISECRMVMMTGINNHGPIITVSIIDHGSIDGLIVKLESIMRVSAATLQRRGADGIIDCGSIMMGSTMDHG